MGGALRRELSHRATDPKLADDLHTYADQTLGDL